MANVAGQNQRTSLILTRPFRLTPSGYKAGVTVFFLFVGYDDDLTHTYSNGKTKKGFIKFAILGGEYWGDKKGYGLYVHDDLNYQKRKYSLSSMRCGQVLTGL